MEEHASGIAVFAAISFLAVVADGGKPGAVWDGAGRRQLSGLAAVAGLVAGAVAGILAEIAGNVAAVIGACGGAPYIQEWMRVDGIVVIADVAGDIAGILAGDIAGLCLTCASPFCR